MELQVTDIMKILPHRYPFLLVDRVVELVPSQRCVGIKNVTMNEPFFQGHFPEMPVMPGVLITEALAQVGGICLLCEEENEGLIPMFTGIDNVRFRTPVVPGDTLRLEVEIVKVKGKMGKVHGKAYVGDKLVASGDYMFALMPHKNTKA